MKKDKLFLIKNIFFYSIIFVESFYFKLRIPSTMLNERLESYIALNRFVLSDIIVALLSLFVFAFIIIFLVGLVKKKFTIIDIPISYIFLTFLLGLCIKIIFNSADYSWHHLGFRNIWPLLSNFGIPTFFALIWFLVPFILSFILLFFLSKRIDFIKLLRIFSIVFFFLMSWQLIAFSNLHSELNKNSLSVNKNLKNSKKVLLIIFDGFDPEMAFSKEENPYELSNFEELKSNSVFHNKMYSPARDTAFSVPGILMGKNVDGLIYENYQLSLMSNNNIIPFNKENSIFGNLEKKGLSTAITGNGFHSYCKMIVGIKCKVFNEPLKWYDGILHIVHYDLFSAHFLKIGSHRDINPQIITAMFDFINSNNPANFLFVHNRVPHLCHQCKDGFSGMAQKRFNYKYSKSKKPLTKFSQRREGYFLNLLFVDKIVGDILITLSKNKNYKDGETLVIFTSDHWAKEEINFKTRTINKNEKKNIYPSLFVAKILGDKTGFKINQPDSSIHLPELIELFFSGNIKNHNDINYFFKNKEGYKVYIPSDIEFVVEKDF